MSLRNICIRISSSDKLSRKKVKNYSETFPDFDSCLNANFNYESLRSRLASHQKNNKNKKPKNEDLVPITFGLILPEKSAKITTSTPRTQKVSKNKKRKKEEITYSTRNSTQKPQYVKILLDSGASASIVHKSYVRKNN